MAERVLRLAIPASGLQEARVTLFLTDVRWGIEMGLWLAVEDPAPRRQG